MTLQTAARHAAFPSTNPGIPVPERIRSDEDYCGRLNVIVRDIHDASRLEEVIPGRVEAALGSLLEVGRSLLYLRDRRRHSLLGRYRCGGRLGARHMFLGPGSIVGLVAMTREPVLIGDVYSTEALRAVHPHLRFDPVHDRELGCRTRAVCAVPVLSRGALLGVYEVANRKGGGEFTLADLGRVQEVARFLGQKLRYDVRATCTPFEFLVRTRRVASDVLEGLERENRGCISRVACSLIKDFELSTELVGTSLERYYQVPYQPFDPGLLPLDKALERVGREELAARGIVLLCGQPDRTIVLTENPNDTSRILEIQQALHLRQFDLRVALRQDIRRYLGTS